MDMGGMGLYGFVGILSFVIGLVKEIATIVLIFKGIQVANTYINRDKNNKAKEKDIDKIGEHKTKVESKEDKEMDK